MHRYCVLSFNGYFRQPGNSHHNPPPGRSNDQANLSLLEDFPGCGVRNNDTFNLCPTNSPKNIYCRRPRLGSRATADFSPECLWDCQWKDNPYLGKNMTYQDPVNSSLVRSVILSMPKVPVDLRCLDSCTTWDMGQGTLTQATEGTVTSRYFI